MKNQRAIIHFAIHLFLFFPAVGNLHAQTVESVLTRLRAKMETMDALRASFSQTTTSSFMDAEHYYGEILLQDESYRIEMNTQTITTNGLVTWVYNRSENQVLINDYFEDETTFSLNTFLSEFDTAYSVESFARKGATENLSFVIKLVPHDDFSPFQSVTIRVRNKDMLVTRLDIIDLNDVQMRIDLTNIEFNPEVPSGVFTFEIPSGVEVIDLREG